MLDPRDERDKIQGRAWKAARNDRWKHGEKELYRGGDNSFSVSGGQERPSRTAKKGH